MKAGYTRDLKTIYNVSGLTGELAEAQKVQISLGGTSIASRDTLNFANAAINTVLFSGFDDGTKVTITGYLPQATYITGGILKLTGDFGGTASIPKVMGVRGFPLTADPVGTNLLLATDNVDGSTLTWMLAGTTAGTYCYGADSRLSNSRIPSGLASGDLSGSYPNPSVTGLKGSPLPTSFSAGTFLQWNIANNGWAAIAYGQAANTVASGNDPRFTNSRIPSGVITSSDLSGSYPSPTVSGLRGYPIPQQTPSGFLQWSTGNTAWNYIIYGTAANTICQGNDSRLSDSRTPLAHASTHASTGSDPLFLKDVSKFKYEYYLRDDLGTMTDWSQATSLGGAAYNTETVFCARMTKNNVGVMRVSPGATSGAFCVAYLNNVNYCLLGSGHQLEFIFAIFNSGYASTGRIGFGDNTTDTTPTNGAYIEVDSAVPRYVYGTTQKGNITKATGSVSITQDIWHTGLIDFYNNTGIKFYIDGTLLGSLSGNLPTGTGCDTTISVYTKGAVTNGFFGIDVDVFEHRNLNNR